MKTERHHMHKTYLSRTFPWGLHLRNGHRLLCSDGKIRAAELAPTADTFFSIPARVRVNGRTISGYATTDKTSDCDDRNGVYTFRHHDKHADALPEWPSPYAKDPTDHAARKDAILRQAPTTTPNEE